MSRSPSITENIRTSSILLHLAAVVVQVVAAEQAGAVAEVHPVAVSGAHERTDFSFPSTRILMSTVWERTATQLCLCHHRKATMMSFGRATVGFTVSLRISNSG